MIETSSGPVSTLPGYTIKVVGEFYCHQCPDPETQGGAYLATWRVQCETDSFSAEYIYLCQKHLREFRKAQQEPRLQQCDLCKTEQTHCGPWRDYEEGMCGPVYTVCASCRRKALECAERGYSND